MKKATDKKDMNLNMKKPAKKNNFVANTADDGMMKKMPKGKKK